MLTRAENLPKKTDITMDEVTAEALAEVIDFFERADRMLASAEARRNNALREHGPPPRGSWRGVASSCRRCKRRRIPRRQHRRRSALVTSDRRQRANRINANRALDRRPFEGKLGPRKTRFAM